MLDNRDNYLIQDENAVLEIAISSVIGDRDEQQDCAGYVLTQDGCVAVVCDGMGGLADGKASARLAVAQMLQTFSDAALPDDPHRQLLDAVISIDRMIFERARSEDAEKNTGTTVVCAVVRSGALHWVSVGDSRIYLCRDGALVQAASDHVYRAVLDRQLDAGAIDAESYREQLKYGHALVSYLGMGELPYIESNPHPFLLQDADRILLASDGLYKTIPEEEIRRILQQNQGVAESLNALERRARERHKRRDNTTVCMIKIHQNGGPVYERDEMRKRPLL